MRTGRSGTESGEMGSRKPRVEVEGGSRGPKVERYEAGDRKLRDGK